MNRTSIPNNYMLCSILATVKSGVQQEERGRDEREGIEREESSRTVRGEMKN